MRSIWVTFSKEGVHFHPEQILIPSMLQKTGTTYFFRYKQTLFEVWIEVTMTDIEFIQFKRWLERLYNDDVIQLNNVFMR